MALHPFKRRDEQQSHHCGIETRLGREIGLGVWGSSNRTIVGLKRAHEQGFGRFGGCSNRTIVGLKHRQTGKGNARERQQSHHCGIETTLNGSLSRSSARAAIAPLWD